MSIEEWEEEWRKKNDGPIKAADIPDSDVRRTAEEICSSFTEYISQHSNSGRKVKVAALKFFSEGKQIKDETGQACLAVSQVLMKIITDADRVNNCEGFDEWKARQARARQARAGQARAGQATGGSQKRRKNTRRKRKDTRRKKKETRRKLRKDTRRKRKDTRRKRKDTRRKTRK
jgi:hypothetical protein